MISCDAKLGKGVVIHHPELVNVYGCEIGDETRIGSFVEIRRSARVGKRCKIQAFAFIPEGVTIEDGCFLGPHVVFTNDRYPRATNDSGNVAGPRDWEIVPTTVREGASIGANATILCGVTIGRGALVGAGAVVTRNVPDFAIVAGVPAKVVGGLRRREERGSNDPLL
jgi:acetyltransferase-like isoleucine patch superfamily enzyme